LKRIAGLLAVVALIHGVLGLWLMRTGRVDARLPASTVTTMVDLRALETAERAEPESRDRRDVSARDAGPAVDARPAVDASPAEASRSPPRVHSEVPEDATEAASVAALPEAETSNVEPQGAVEPPVAIASTLPEARETALPELAEGRSLRRLKVYLGDYTAAQSVARVQLEVEVISSRYLVRSQGEAEGLIALLYSGTLTQESRGRLGPQGLMPEQYVETRGARRPRSVRLDWQAHQLRPADGPPVELADGTQDRLSVLYQLGLMARAQPDRFIEGARIEIPVATLREVRLERFEVMGEEILIVQDRPWRTLHLKRPRVQSGRDPSVQVWLGYDAGLQPIRIRLEDANGQVLDQVIDEP